MSDTDDKPMGGEAVNGSMRPGNPSVRPAPEPVGAEPEAQGATGEAGAAGDAPKNAELEKAQADAAKYKDQLLRTAADFDNFRKRTRRELEEAQRKGLEKALLELLPVADNLERAVSAAQGTTDVQSIVEGVRMVLRFYEDALGRLGVERVGSVGQPFDPGLHEAVQQVPSDSPVGTVVTEMAPGYKLGGKLLRPAVVAVAVPKPPGNGAAEGGDGVAEPPQN